MKCKHCLRQLPNKNHITKNGCKWCDLEYFRRKNFICSEKNTINYEKTIAFDLDGTLCETIRKGHPEDILKVKPKICNSNDKYKTWIDILKNLKEKGYRIIIFTRREVLPKGRELTKQWLKKYQVPYDELITKKPHYNLFIDDRAISAYQPFITPEIIEETLKFIKNGNRKTGGEK